jgi:SPP1 family predicted phage head-tail adaptor
MTIGKMRHRVTIQTLIATPDADNAVEEVYSNVATVWADVSPVSGRTEMDSKSLGERITHRVTMRYRADVTSENWILYRGLRFRVRNIQDFEERRRFMILECEDASKEGAFVEE